VAPAYRERIAADGVEVAVFVLGPSRVELLTPTDPASTVHKFLEQRGEALHHLAYAVPDVHAALRQAQEAGAQLIDREPRPGAGGKLVAFIHPKSAHGVLTELVQTDGR
jgi:methylmalonyl-CoA/ethylmalonyl-CoA epimerase